MRVAFLRSKQIRVSAFVRERFTQDVRSPELHNSQTSEKEIRIILYIKKEKNIMRELSFFKLIFHYYYDG